MAKRLTKTKTLIILKGNGMFEMAGNILASLGGAALIMAGFAHFLGNIWIDRISKQTTAKYANEFENLKNKNDLALETFKAHSSLSLRENENFATISKEFYQDFFKSRVDTYQTLLKLKNQYITEIEEDFVTDMHEKWGHVYYNTYSDIRAVMIERQLYISNDLEKLFNKLRSAASKYIKEADFLDSLSLEDGIENPGLESIHNAFAEKTNKMMNALFKQIETDVTRLRSRIEIDKA